MISFVDLAGQQLDEIEPRSMEDLLNHLIEVHEGLDREDREGFYSDAFWCIKVYAESKKL